MINLLPLSFKAELKNEENLRLLIVLLVLLFLFLLSLALLLGAFRIYLGGEIRTEETRLILAKEEFDEKGVKDAIKTLNNDVLNTVRFYRGQVGLQEVFLSLERSLPTTMRLENISYIPSTESAVKEDVEVIPAKFILSGFAPTRENLFTFKENLEKDSLFTNISFPSSNWVNYEDITFSISFELAI